MRNRIHRGFKVLREEGLYILIIKTTLYLVAPFRRRYKKHRIKLLTSYRIVKNDIPIFITWIIHYTLRNRFRYIVRNPVFIVGCGHSGTTLLLRVIGSHPNFHAILDESYLFCQQTYRLTCQQAYYPTLVTGFILFETHFDRCEWDNCN